MNSSDFTILIISLVTIIAGTCLLIWVAARQTLIVVAP